MCLDLLGCSGDRVQQEGTWTSQLPDESSPQMLNSECCRDYEMRSVHNGSAARRALGWGGSGQEEGASSVGDGANLGARITANTS